MALFCGISFNRLLLADIGISDIEINLFLAFFGNWGRRWILFLIILQFRCFLILLSWKCWINGLFRLDVGSSMIVIRYSFRSTFWFDGFILILFGCQLRRYRCFLLLVRFFGFSIDWWQRRGFIWGVFCLNLRRLRNWTWHYFLYIYIL